MNWISKRPLVLVLISTIATQGSAWAAGFAIREQSGSALSSAFSGATAGAEDISHMFFNPAGLTRQSGTRISATMSYVSAQAEFDPTAASSVIGAPLVGGNGGSNIVDDALIPRTRKPRIPEDDRTWASAGISYQPIDRSWPDLGSPSAQNRPQRPPHQPSRLITAIFNTCLGADLSLKSMP